ncbi:sensor domain-containing diguanylate cyclase [Melaminivora sp.]
MPDPTSTSTTHKPLSSARRLDRWTVRMLLGLQILLALIVMLALYFSGQHLRHLALEHTRSHTQAQNQNLEVSLTQHMNLLGMHLRALAAEHPEIQYAEHGINPLLLQKALQSLEQKLPYIRSLSILTHEGQVIASSHEDNIGRRLSLEPLLPRVAGRTTGLLRFGTPWRGRDFSDGRPWPTGPLPSPAATPHSDAGFFPVMLVLPEAPQWALVAAINSDYFINLALAHQIAGQLQHQLYLDSGSLLFSTAESDEPGTVMADTQHLQALLEAQVGTAQWPTTPDSDIALVAYRVSRQYPWFVQTQASSSHALQAWHADMRQVTLLALGALFLVLLTTGWLTWRVYRGQQREQRQQEEERLAASVFEHSSDLIAITNPKGEIITVNPAFERSMGYQQTEVMGRIPGQIDPQHPAPTDFAKRWQSIADDGTWEGEVIDRRKDGSLLTGWLLVNAIYDHQGQPAHYVGVLRDLSRLREDEVTIRKLSLAIEQSPTSIMITSMAPAIEYANPEFYRATGYSPQEMLGANPNVLQSGETSVQTYRDMWGQLKAGKVWKGEFVNRRKDGSLYIEQATIAPLVDNQGTTTHYLAIKQDVTLSKATEKALRLAASVVANTHEGVLICDPQLHIVEVNPSFERITGYSASEVLGRKPNVLASERRNRELYPNLWQALHKKGHWQGDFWNRRKDGSLYAIASSINALRDDKGQITHYINVFSDITDRKNQQQNLELLAHFDPLTRLPNRTLLADRLHQALARAQREQQLLALCFMDLDGFKGVNDTLGHDAGDDLLVEIARRLEQTIRSGDTAARLGGDEFVLLLCGLHHPQECQGTAQRVLQAVARPVLLEGDQTAHVTGSMGIALFPQDSHDPQQLMQQADQAMYQAKQAGRNRYLLYTPEMEETAARSR